MVRARPGRVSCPACSASWQAAAARYCGRCGTLLPAGAAAAGAAARRRTVPPRGGRTVAGAVLAGAVLAGAVLAGVTALAGAPDLATLWPGDAAGPAPPGSGPDAPVSLPAPAEVTPAPEVADPAPQAGDVPRPPPRTSCEPAGCERWRAPLDPRDTGPVAASDELVVVLAPQAAVALDARTGERRWRAGLRDLVPLASDGTPIAELTGGMHVTVTVDERTVLVTTPTRLAAIDAATGERRWQARSSTWELRTAALLDDVAVVTGGSGRRAGPNPRVVALDLADGRTRWDMVLGEPVHTFPRAVTATTADGHLVGLDPASGDERWRSPLPPGRWPVRAGPWLAVDEGAGHRLVDPASGATVAALDGHLSYDVLTIDGSLVSIVTPGPGPPRVGTGRPPPVLVAIAPDGTLRWARHLDARDGWRCCSTLVPWGDGVLLGSVVGEGALLVDPRDGALLRDDLVVPLDGRRWRTEAGALARWDGRRLLLVAAGGPLVEVVGPGLELVADAPLVARGGGELLALRVPPDGG